MDRTISNSVILSGSAKDLYKQYLDSEGHQAITGMAAEIDAQPGGSFRAFDGMLGGTILQLITERLIVQSWRSVAFSEDDDDSTLILCFTPEGDKTRLDLVHLGVPAHDFSGVSKGWEQRYFGPWERHLTS